jgi:uncharacterized protein (DUF2345 family)
LNKGITVRSKNTIRLAAVLIATLSAGCASIAVTGDAIEQNTAVALGLEKGAFTISDRADEGIKTTYIAKVNKTGKKYSCYVTGTVGYTGRETSDAICTEAGKAAKPSSASGGGACNALLKAGGKC